MRNLPARPNIEHLKRRARRLQRAYRDADPASVASVRHYDSAFGVAADGGIAESSFSILDAQRVVAREHGFRSWPALARYVEAARDDGRPARNRGLADRLTALREANVATKERMRARLKGSPLKHYLRELAEPQERDADVLFEVFDEHGWPTADTVGHAASEAVLRTVGDLFTQGPLNRLAIEHLSARVSDGKAPSGWLALLVDHADLLSGLPVPYGIVSDVDERGRVSMGNDVLDPPNLDRRRATVGYEPIAEARRWWFELAARENRPVTKDRETYRREVEETAVAGRWR